MAAHSNTDTSKHIIDRLGQLTKTLHNCLSELGHDQRLQQVNLEVANSKDGLAYVIDQTTQAAECSLSAIEHTQPIVQQLTEHAAQLHTLWQQIPDAAVTTVKNHPDLNNLYQQTLSFLDGIPEQTTAVQVHLTEIMLAQNFHDLTGQAIQKIARVIEMIEQEIQQLLTEEDLEKKITAEQKNSLLNGPVINPHQQHDVCTDQDQIDDLFTKLSP